MSKIKRNPAYKAIHANKDKRYVIITGGRGSGKSFEIATGLVLQTYEEKQRVLFTRLTMTSAHLSIIPEFVEKLDLLDVGHVFNVNRAEITNKMTGSDIIFKGIKASSGDQSANLKSISGVNTWVMDEAEELMDEATFDKIDFSIRVKEQKNTIYLILNPTTKEHWIWKRFFENTHKFIEIDGCQIPISTHPQVLHLHTTYLDNLGNLNESFLDNIAHMKKSNFAKYEQVVIGGWRQKPEGVVFDSWKQEKFNDRLPYVWGMDFGYAVDPTTLVKCAIDDYYDESNEIEYKQLYMKEYCYKPQMSTDDILELLARHVKKHELIIADCAEPRLINEIRQNGWSIMPARKGKDSIMAGISKMKDYELLIDPKSTNLMTEFDNYAWDEQKGKPIDMYNHGIDAIRYAMEQLAQTSSFYFK
jgi:phage terminase large subunit